MLKSTRKSKNRYFYHIFVSPGDTFGAITLNVVWVEREFDAYKLFRCIGGFPSEYRHPVWRVKLEWLGYPVVEKFRRYLNSF